ncbi:MAG: thioesterase family protein [Candidatus Acidiferrum sp.]
MEFHDATIRVRYAETDQMGVVYHANYFVWFEVGRVELIRALGIAYKRMETEDDCHIVVVDAHCRYQRPALYDDVLRVRTRIAKAANRTVEFSYEVFRARHVGSERPAGGDTDEVLATGATTHVICGRDGRAKLLPEKYRSIFQSVAQAPTA